MPNQIKKTLLVTVIILSVTSTYVLAQSRSTENIFIPPTGSYVIGRMSFDWVDSTRKEIFSNQEGARREIMVYVYYPAQKKLTPKAAPYIPYLIQTEKALGDSNMVGQFGDAYSMIKSGQIKSHSVENAAISLSLNKYPVLVFSHGFGESGLTYSLMLEDLASHGYIIFSIEHPYDAYAVAFPDGRIIPFASEKWNEAIKIRGGAVKYQTDQIPIRAADILFVIDKIIFLNKTKNKSIFSHLDIEKIGVFGHSLGGMAAARVCQLSDRVKACMNQDAELKGPPYVVYSPNDAIKQPFLFFASPQSLYVTKNTPSPTKQDLENLKLTRQAYDSIMTLNQNKQDEALSNMNGGSYRISIEKNGFVHRSFIDTKLFENKIDSTTLSRNQKNLRTIRAYTLSFFDKYLKGMSAPLLDSSSYRNPDVTIDKFPARLK